MAIGNPKKYLLSHIFIKKIVTLVGKFATQEKRAGAMHHDYSSNLAGWALNNYEKIKLRTSQKLDQGVLNK